MTTRDIYYRMYMNMRFFSLFFVLTRHSFFFLTLYHFERIDRAAMKAGMVFVIYLICLNITYTHMCVCITLRFEIRTMRNRYHYDHLV